VRGVKDNGYSLGKNKKTSMKKPNHKQEIPIEVLNMTKASSPRVWRNRSTISRFGPNSKVLLQDTL